MAHIKIATLNINGLSSPTKMAMLVEFMRLQEIVIILVQEVTKPVLHNIYGYNTYYNIGATMRGTVIITRESISLENVTVPPSVRAIAAKCREIQGLAMVDTWQPNTDRRVYTHISASGASRLDCIYVTKELNSRKRGVEVVAAAFTDHLALCLRLSAEFLILRTGCGMWKMDNDILTEITGINKMLTLWERLHRHNQYYPDKTM